MSNQIELVADERVVTGKKVRHLRRQGIVPANMYGHNLASVPLQVNAAVLARLLAHGGNNVILALKVGNRPAVQAFIKKVQRNFVSGETLHVDFHRVAATETLRTHVPLHFVNEAAAASAAGASVLRLLNELMVECLPGDLPSSIEVDLSLLSEAGAVIRVANLTTGPNVTIITDQNEMVAAVHQQARAEKVEEAEAKPKPVEPS